MSDNQPEAEKRQAPTKLIGAGIIIVALVLFVVQNAEEVTIKWLVFSFDAPVWTALVISMVLAFVLGLLMGRSKRKS